MQNQKTILITGASRGIGLCCALALKTRGYEVFATARNNIDLENLNAQGLHSILLELNDSTSIQQAVNAVLTKTGGKLAILFNNAGYGQPGAVEDLTRNAIREQFETNVFGAIELTNLIIPVMRKQNHGRIIFTSSVLGLVSLPYRGAYNASKYALEGFADSLRLELANSPIEVSLIEPGPIQSHFRATALKAYKEKINPSQSHFHKTYQHLEKYYAEDTEMLPDYLRPPELVLAKLIKAIESKHPKIRYYVTSSTIVLATLKRILPYRVLDWLLLKIQAMGDNK